MRTILDRALGDAVRLLEAWRQEPETMASLESIGRALSDTLRRGDKILACGNGGSLADAMHFCEELTGQFRGPRPPLAAHALSDPTHMSCTANDYGFQEVFRRGVRALGRKGDALLVLSTSGNSESVVLAAEAARELQMTVIGFLGKDGGKTLPLCDHVLMAPGSTSDRIQEIHMLCLHALIEAIEVDLGLA